VIGLVVLAAGGGSRYGGLKQLHPVDGRPMLERVLERVAGASIEQRIVVLGAHADTLRAAIDTHGALVVLCPQWASGQAAALRVGLDALPPQVGAAMIVLGDGPGITPQAIDRLAGEAVQRSETALAADYGAGRSHPVLFPRSLWPRLPVRGEAPGRGIPVELVDCSDLQPPGDVDYPS
jgi:molybdenum cofactor cytidylyltransferase